MRTDIAAASNARVGPPIVEYETDPRGLRAFLAATADVADRLNPTTSGQRFYVGPNNWHGDTISPQAFTGLAQLGRARVVSERSSRMSREREASPTNAAAMAVFAERARRR